MVPKRALHLLRFLKEFQYIEYSRSTIGFEWLGLFFQLAFPFFNDSCRRILHHFFLLLYQKYLWFVFVCLCILYVFVFGVFLYLVGVLFVKLTSLYFVCALFVSGTITILVSSQLPVMWQRTGSNQSQSDRVGAVSPF